MFVVGAVFGPAEGRQQRVMQKDETIRVTGTLS